MDSKQRGKQVGENYVAKMRALFDEMVETCGNDHEVILVATGHLGRAMSLADEASPLTQKNRATLRSAAIALHAQGWSDERIGKLLGVSRSRVQGLRTSEREGARKSEQSGHRKPPVTRDQHVEMDTLPGFDAA